MKFRQVLSVFMLTFVALSSAKATGNGFRFEEHPDLEDENFPFRLIPEQHRISKRQATAADDTFNTAQTVMNVTKAYMVREWEAVRKFNQSIVGIIVDQQELLRNYIKDDHGIDMTGVPGTQLTDVVKEKTDNQTALLEIETKAAELIVQMCERILELIGTPTLNGLVPPIDGLDPKIRDNVINVICNANTFFFNLCSSNDETTPSTTITEAPADLGFGGLRNNPDNVASDRVDSSVPSASDFADQSSASGSNPDEESSNPDENSDSSNSNPDDSEASSSNPDQPSESSSSNPDQPSESSNSNPDESSDSPPFSSSFDESDDDFMAADPTPSTIKDENVTKAPDTASDRFDTNVGEDDEKENDQDDHDHDHEDQDHQDNEDQIRLGKVEDGKTSAVIDNGATAISASISVILLVGLAISASLCL